MRSSSFRLAPDTINSLPRLIRILRLKAGVKFLFCFVRDSHNISESSTPSRTANLKRCHKGAVINAHYRSQKFGINRGFQVGRPSRKDERGR